MHLKAVKVYDHVRVPLLAGGAVHAQFGRVERPAQRNGRQVLHAEITGRLDTAPLIAQLHRLDEPECSAVHRNGDPT